MRYTLWSRGRLVGHTDLDIHTFSANMRQGFIEPTEEGRPLLRDATGVWRVMADVRREARERDGERLPEDSERFMAACSKREALDLELRDENDRLFECDFMRVYDLFDINSGIVEEMSGTEEEQEAEYQAYLSALTPDERLEAEARRAADEAEIEEFVAQRNEERDEEDMFHSSWPPQPDPDERWETMQYHLQVFLKGAAELEEEF